MALSFSCWVGPLKASKGEVPVNVLFKPLKNPPTGPEA